MTRRWILPAIALLALAACGTTTAGGGAAGSGGGASRAKAAPRANTPATPITVTDEGWPSRRCLGFTPDGRYAYILRFWNKRPAPAVEHYVNIRKLELATRSHEALDWYISEEYDDPSVEGAYPEKGQPNATQRGALALNEALENINAFIARDKLVACQESIGNGLKVTVPADDPIVFSVSSDGGKLVVSSDGTPKEVGDLSCLTDFEGSCSGPMEVIHKVFWMVGGSHALALTGTSMVAPRLRPVKLP